MEQTLEQRLRKLETYIYGLPAARKLNTLTRQERAMMAVVMDNASLARGQVVFSAGDEDREAQVQGLALAIEELQAAQQALHDASMHGLVDAVDFMQITALGELCIDELKRMVTM